MEQGEQQVMSLLKVELLVHAQAEEPEWASRLPDPEAEAEAEAEMQGLVCSQTKAVIARVGAAAAWV